MRAFLRCQRGKHPIIEVWGGNSLVLISLLGCSSQLHQDPDPPAANAPAAAQRPSVTQTMKEIRRNQEIIEKQRREIQLLKQRTLEY